MNFPDNGRSALQNLLYGVPTALLDNRFMCAIDNFTLRIRDILSFLGTHGLGRSFRYGKVSCIDEVMQYLADISSIPVIHFILVNIPLKHFLFVETRLYDFCLTQAVTDSVKSHALLGD